MKQRDRVMRGNYRSVVLVPEAKIVVKRPRSPRGRRCNLAEANFWEETKNPLLAPTLAVIDSGVNIQRWCLPLDVYVEDEKLLGAIKDIVGVNLYHSGLDILLSSTSWGVRRIDRSGPDRLQLFDYHPPSVQRVAIEYGQTIFDNFDVEEVFGPDWKIKHWAFRKDG